MKLLAKFNLILLVIFGASGLLICQFAYRFLINNARREVLAQAELMVAGTRAGSADGIARSRLPAPVVAYMKTARRFQGRGICLGVRRRNQRAKA